MEINNYFFGIHTTLCLACAAALWLVKNHSCRAADYEMWLYEEKSCFFAFYCNTLATKH